MKRYDEYKQTGTPWIGEIPSHWECKQFRYAIKHITTGLNPRSNFVLGEGNNYYVTIRNFENGKLNLDSECDNINDEALKIIHKRSDLKKGDILFASISEEGKAYVLRENPSNWDINESVFSIRPNKELNSDFLFYVLTDNSFYKPLRIGATGTTFSSIKQEQLKGALIAIPPIVEQQLIVEYIDSKIKPIDAVISTQERRIALLEELKQSVITEAVTHGINPDAKLRPSGIDWIGNIPEHWEVMPLKRTMHICNGADYKHIEAEDGYPVIGSGGIFAYASDYLFDGEALLLGRKGTIDKPLYFKGKFWTVDTMFYSIPQKFIVCKYMYYQSLNFPFDRYSTSTALPSMTSRDLGNNDVCVPPLSEQEEIVEYIERKLKPIDASITKAKREIELLKELKQSVITEAVTGKIKVC